MEKLKNLFSREVKPDHIVLTSEQKQQINQLTLGLPHIDESILEMVVEQNDVIKTLQNGHPLNKLITNNEGNLTGYIACEDFIPHEAYIKYLGTDGNSGRNLLSELPAFFDYAKSHGYIKLNFHGWNDRLNTILTRYGFEKLRTDSMGSLNADFYQKILLPNKTDEQVQTERNQAFADKFNDKMKREYQKTIETFKENKTEKENTIATLYSTITRSITTLGEKQQLILKLKLARYLQTNESIDTNVLIDALAETPKYLETDKGGLHRLLEIHQEKTLMKIAEMRKAKAEQGSEGFNPYESLFTTESGNYYMARLLNMPHLESESAYMNHCVGTSDSYISKLKRGEIEILSFRKTPTIDTENNRLNDDDTPLITIEYNLKTKVIQQMKKYDDEYLQTNDLYYSDVLDALSKLRETKTDTGVNRDFTSINASELQNISVPDYHILTNIGELSLSAYDPNNSDIFILKKGSMQLNETLPHSDIEKIIHIETGEKIHYDEIAFGSEQINEQTKMYIGPWSPQISLQIPETVTHLYEQFPESKILRTTLEINPKTPEQYETELINGGNQISDYAKDILYKMPPLEKSETINIVSYTVAQLGFTENTPLSEIKARALSLGLKLCLPQVGPELRLSFTDQPMNTYYNIAMESILDRGDVPTLFNVDRDDGGDDLSDDDGGETVGYRPSRRFVFAVSK